MNLTIQHLENDDPIVLSVVETGLKVGEKEYEIIDQSGELKENAIYVLNYVPVNHEAKERFEMRFLSRPKLIEKEAGFISIRVLRPKTDDTYLILSQWETVEAFRDWQSSKAYQHAHKKRGTKEGLDKEKGVLSGKPYHHLYKTKR
ncbi:antibiotic biosynthesis monooxygenase family protein [Oceanobacillus manasiensis]|uniref:antibiotic biosynthesis monooxygenase family protein n=1 Tax=Oceanobacillus manasiensis TaxID=586413 RepID=UPI0005A5F08F|nr:antibiotic biosynthesis monooxygenase [Oceanobacillus manasiensis]